MAAKKKATSAHLKQRTRAHVIADLSANFVERVVLRRDFSVERVEHDYGIDLILATFTTNGFVENGWVHIQLKATDNLKVVAKGQEVAFGAEVRDLNAWVKEVYPVMLVVFDAKKSKAYWAYIQHYFKSGNGKDQISKKTGKLKKKTGKLTVRLSRKNVVTPKAIDRFREFKAKVLAEAQTVVTHAV